VISPPGLESILRRTKLSNSLVNDPAAKRILVLVSVKT
jgi:hypothetical protein